MRRWASMAVMALVVTACADATLDEPGETVDTSLPSLEQPADVETTTTVPASTTTVSETTTTVEAMRLSISDALLPDDAFAKPWELTSRVEHVVGFEIGPYQSSCPEWETFERFLSRSGGTVRWWSDGGNATQHVSRVTDSAEASEIISMIGAATTCQTVSWGEGGRLLLRSIELADGIVGFESRSDVQNEKTWVAATTHGDLVSLLWVPLWPRLGTGSEAEFIDMTVEDFAAIAVEMRDLLRAAGPARPGEPEAPEPEPPVSATTTTNPITTTTTAPRSATDQRLIDLLLSNEELGAEWTFDIERAPPPADLTTSEECPQEAAGPALIAQIDWYLAGSGSGSETFQQGIGTVSDQVAIEDLIGRFGQIGSCDPEVLGAESMEGGELSLAGADHAAMLSLAESGQAYVLVVFSVDDVVSMIAVQSEGTIDDLEVSTIDLAQLAAQKLAGS